MLALVGDAMSASADGAEVDEMPAVHPFPLFPESDLRLRQVLTQPALACPLQAWNRRLSRTVFGG